jgi:hypothetical protein
MKRTKQIVLTLGALSLACLAAFTLLSLVTFHPSIQGTADRLMILLLALSVLSAVANIGLGLVPVVRTRTECDPEVLAVRRQSLWLSVPQLLILAALFVSGFHHA